MARPHNLPNFLVHLILILPSFREIKDIDDAASYGRPVYNDASVESTVRVVWSLLKETVPL
jgi:hypothetical protein